MENQSKDSLDYAEPQLNFQKEARIEDLWGMVKTVSTAPTWTPRKFSEQFAIYSNSTTYRFYWYDTTNNAWRYASGT